jgi:hypothetical protein
MNAPEAAVRHENHEIARPMLANDGGDDIVEGGGLPRGLPGIRQIANELRNR